MMELKDLTESITKMENVNFQLSFNTNDHVWVELTNFGKKIYIDYYNNMKPFNFNPIKVDGLLDFQLWCLMEIFGKHMMNGGENLFVNNKIYFNIRENES